MKIFLLFLQISLFVFSFPSLKMSTLKYISKASCYLQMSDTKPKTPLRIAVVGSGIGGVYLGCSLQTKGFDVTVFEKSGKV
jgi:pyruvate/2-oxoglutarate dehydrogenase complex dihydrolipoamide dehydrogenase (E3) component